MSNNIELVFEKVPAVLARTTWCTAILYKNINDGLWPIPTKVGKRAVGFLKHETNAVLAAMANEQSEDQIKELVKDLKAKRKELLEQTASEDAALES